MIPKISRRSSVLTATATITAIETIRLPSRSFTYVASSQRKGQSVALQRPVQKRLHPLVDLRAYSGTNYKSSTRHHFKRFGKPACKPSASPVAEDPLSA